MPDLPPDIRRAFAHLNARDGYRKALELAAKFEREGSPVLAAQAREVAEQNEMLILLTEDPGGDQ